MNEFLIYQGKTAIALAVFYMFYRLLLSKETFHRFNRIVLLGTAALSFVLPLCVITFKEVVVVPAMTASSETFTGEVAGTSAMAPEVSEPIWPVILCSLFALGALAVLVHIVFSIIGIRRMIRSGSRQALESGETLIITETDTAPFSWMKYIVISREDYESGGQCPAASGTLHAYNKAIDCQSERNDSYRRKYDFQCLCFHWL